MLYCVFFVPIMAVVLSGRSFFVEAWPAPVYHLYTKGQLGFP